MADHLLAPIMPAAGLAFLNDDNLFVSTVNVVRGAIFEVDSSGSNAAGLNNITGSASSRDAIAVTPTSAAAIGGRQLCIALHNAVSGKKFKGRIAGEVYARVFGVVQAGALLVLQVGGDDASGKRIFGRTLESGGTALQADLIRILWDGTLGFGQLPGGIGVPPNVPIGADVVPGPPGDDGGSPVPVGQIFVPR
jgi:hypothetical protein